MATSQGARGQRRYLPVVFGQDVVIDGLRGILEIVQIELGVELSQGRLEAEVVGLVGLQIGGEDNGCAGSCRSRR